MRGFFVTATGTGAGKTFVTRGLAAALRRRGHSVGALKPLETGCHPDPTDALALARACGQPGLARADGLYRVAPPLAPYAATLAGCPAPPAPARLAERSRALLRSFDVALVEGAGGLLVPLDATHTMADLAAEIGLPLLLVAHDALGVLSFTLTACEAARSRSLPLAAVVLTRHERQVPDDPSREANARILAERLHPVPVLTFPCCPDDDDALARAAAEAGLPELYAEVTRTREAR
ncbi:MAG: dethiobiotin synthase [Myxococcota bacterium]